MNTPSQVSFLPDDYLDTKRQARTNAMCAALFIVVVLGIGSAFTIMENSMKGIDRQLAQVSSRYTDAARPIAQFRQMQEKQRTMDSEAALTASLLEKAPRSYILAQVTNALPAGVSLLDFNLEAKVHAAPTAAAAQAAPRTKYEIKRAETEAKRNAALAAAPEAKTYDVNLKLTGVADSDVQVAAYIKALSDSPLFQDVNLVVSDEFEQAKQKLRRFQIEFVLNPDADVRSVARPLHTSHTLIDAPATQSVRHAKVPVPVTGVKK
jgi:Tfp pilus assembly protein PilN